MFGKLKQKPPMYSAVKVGGKKLYEYARNGLEIDRNEREVEVFDVSVSNINYEENEIQFLVNCSKGTYIRTLCEQIAEKLGTVGYMKYLQRTKVNEMKIEDAIDLNLLEKMTLDQIEEKIISIEKVFENEKRINMTEKGITLLKNGVMLTYNYPDRYI